MLPHTISSRPKVLVTGLYQTMMKQTAAPKAASPYSDFRAIVTPHEDRLGVQPKGVLPASESRLLSRPLPLRKLGPTREDVFRPSGPGIEGILQD